jgi:hypothetical protein
MSLLPTFPTDHLRPCLFCSIAGLLALKFSSYFRATYSSSIDSLNPWAINLPCPAPRDSAVRVHFSFLLADDRLTTRTVLKFCCAYCKYERSAGAIDIGATLNRRPRAFAQAEPRSNAVSLQSAKLLLTRIASQALKRPSRSPRDLASSMLNLATAAIDAYRSGNRQAESARPVSDPVRHELRS